MDMKLNVKKQTIGNTEVLYLYDTEFMLGYCITDYSLLSNELQFDNKEVHVGKVKEKTVISSINDLRNTIESIANKCIEILNKCVITQVEPFFQIALTDVNVNSLVNQLIFDILHMKYINDSPCLTATEYSHEIARIHDKISEKTYINRAENIRKKLSTGLTKYYELYKYSDLKEEFRTLGYNAENVADMFNPNLKNKKYSKKPFYIWDMVYLYQYTFFRKQFNRNFDKTNRNYTLNDLMILIIEHNELVKDVLPCSNESHRNFFNATMRYYHIESYKRFDFLLKYANSSASELWDKQLKHTEPDQITQFALNEFKDKNAQDVLKQRNVFLEQFTPLVLIPFLDNDSIDYKTNYKSYRPMLLIENDIIDEISTNFDFMYFAETLKVYYVLRAMAIETFNYYFKFISDDYGEIKKFLVNSYNLLKYHEDNAVIYDKIQGYIGAQESQKKEIEKLVIRFINANKCLFWKSNKRRIK